MAHLDGPIEKQQITLSIGELFRVLPPIPIRAIHAAGHQIGGERYVALNYVDPRHRSHGTDSDFLSGQHLDDSLCKLSGVGEISRLGQKGSQFFQRQFVRRPQRKFI